MLFLSFSASQHLFFEFIVALCVFAIPVLFVVAIPCVFVFAIRCVFLFAIPVAIVRRGKRAIDGVGACSLLAKCIQLFKLLLVNQLLSLKLQGDG